MTIQNEDFQQLDEFVRERMVAACTPGFAAAFFDKDESARVATYGYANLETKTPVTPETLFEIGSITKTFTAVAVMQSVEKGLLDLHRPVTDYLPWFDVQTEYESITLHHLLTHTAGLVGVIDKTPDIRSAVWALRDTEVAWPPGSQCSYSDAGYQTLALILETIHKKPFADIIRTNIFEPLGMGSSEPVLTHQIRPRLATGYRSLYDDRPSHASHPLVPVTWMEVSSGDCSIASTAEDMAKFGQLLLNRGEGPTGKVLSQPSYDLLVHPHTNVGWCDYGYGIMIQQQDSFTHIGHGGGMPGYVAEVIVDIDNGVGVALLSTEPKASGLFWQILRYWRALRLAQPLPTIELAQSDPFVVTNAAEYVGMYRSGTKEFTIRAEHEHLILHYGGLDVMLECRGADRFYVNHPDFDKFLLQFGRLEANHNESGEIVEAMFGADWYAKNNYSGVREFSYPSEWNAYPGHYRSHNPWQTNFRVVLRKGILLIVWPDGSEEPLIHRFEKSFYVRVEGGSEQIRFNQFIDGQALCAIYSACEYYRFFTP